MTNTNYQIETRPVVYACSECGERAMVPADGTDMFCDAHPHARIDGPIRGGWTTDGIEATPGSNLFSSRQEAETAIESLRKLGEDWTDAEYRIVAVNA